MKAFRDILRVLVSLAFAALSASCGAGSAGDGFSSGDAATDARSDATLDAARKSDAPIIILDGGVKGADVCVGLACQQTCAATTISGKVYDPAGLVPLYNVFVYVPNAPLEPITTGPVCTQCQAPATGDPLVSVSTLADGSFILKNAPSGKDIPIVLQLGKWRRHLTLPDVPACATTTAAPGFFRFPRIQGETSPDDNIPLIAFTTGCDGAECFLNSRIGIDKSEFTSPTGTGRVRVYQGNDATQTFPGGQGNATQLWGSTPNEMLQYDIIFDACECEPYDRGGAGGTDVGYKNFLDYLNMGGRAFTTHYFYNFYADVSQCAATGEAETCQGQSPLPTVGAWEKNDMSIPFAPLADCPNDMKSGFDGDCMRIDTSIPKGVALAQWYAANNTVLKIGGREKYGFVGLTDIRMDMGALEPSLIEAGTATPWLYSGDLTSSYDAFYFSINSPVGTNAATQCGRAIFSDVHLDAEGTGTFPSYCPTDPNSSSHAPNELALEFLFFDLASCVQNDTQPPPPPPQPK